MKKILLSLLVAMVTGGMGVLAGPAGAAQLNAKFDMIPSPGVGTGTCLNTPGKLPVGHVTINHLGAVETLHVEVFNLKPNTEYDLFLIQVPNKPFGLSWYQGDVETDGNGRGVGDFIGRFSVETFVVAPGSATVPVPVHPKDATQPGTNPAIPNPIHTFHLGLWFNSPADAASVGCAATGTPFNGDHTAGIQVLNTAGFPDDRGPLRNFRP